MNKLDILILEDDVKLAKLYLNILTKKGYSIKHVVNSDDFFCEFNLYKPSILILDINLVNSKFSGLEVLKILVNKSEFDSKVIMLSGEASRTEVAEAMKLGAYTFIEKSGNFNLQKFLVDVQQAFKLKQEEDKNNFLKKQNSILTSKILDSIPFIGESENIVKVRELLMRYVKKGVNILIEGETGTGKEVIADYAYWHSDRAGKPFKKVNISALTPSLELSSLFGHRKGAFTGADQDYEGFFLQANTGVLFLDEIASISLSTQAMILRAIENNEIEVLGGKTQEIDVIYYFATNKSLMSLVRNHEFREDLYYRLSANIINLPPLRERGRDIVLLFNYYLEKFGFPKSITNYNDENIYDILSEHKWGGNIRELRNFANLLSTKYDFIDEKVIKQEMLNLKKNINSNNDSALDKLLNIENYNESIDQFSKIFIIEKLRQNNFRITQTANSIGLTRPTFYRLMKKLGIDKDEIEFFN